MRYRHLFFDLDHTLWDFEANAKETLRDLYGFFDLKEKGLPDFDAFHARFTHHNEVLWDRFRKGFINRIELRWKRMWLTLVDFKIGDEWLAHEMSNQFQQILPTKTRLFPHTVEVLDYLKDRHYLLYLITNGFEETQLLKLRHAGLAHYFTHIITSEVAGSLKPHKAIFDYALQLAGTTAPQSLMIGDALEVDILGAKNAGMDQVYFGPVSAQEAELQPTYSIRHLQELKTIL